MSGSKIPGPTCAADLNVGGTPSQKPGQAAPSPVGMNKGSSSGPTLTGWPRSISWDEFQEVASRPSGADENAQIHTEVVQPERVGVEREHGRLRLGSYTARVQIRSADTWVVQGQKTDALLAHEQVHFDITGLSGRDLVSDLAALRAADAEELQREVTRLIQQHSQLANQLTEQYDDETDHGRNTQQQQRWESHIRSCIQQGTRLSAPP